LHPEWCDRRLVTRFLHWHNTVLPQTDLVLAISRSTAHDAGVYAARHRIPLPGPVRTIPVGTGFSPPLGQAAPPPSSGLPEPGSYVLMVSTIEARKNHLLLFRVWQRLLAGMSRESVPKLVFAGRVGWMVGDLMAQLDNTGWLDGHIVLIENPSDADLAALYRGCLFTLFPSFYEGWGLPVTESLAFGKPCLTADNSSLPEAGGGLTRTFDADDLHSATRAIRETLEDRAGLAAWEARIRAEFHPVPWRDAGEAVLAACQSPHTENISRS
jgi:glycosyltransferase involved in cell wall biosynthesis